MYEHFLLHILPLGFAVKTLILFVLWFHLWYRTKAKGELGKRINMSFRSTWIMSAFHTWLMLVLSFEIQPDEIDWPALTLLLTGLVVWPFRVSWTHYRVYTHYHRMMKKGSRHDITTNPVSRSG